MADGLGFRLKGVQLIYDATNKAESVISSSSSTEGAQTKSNLRTADHPRLYCYRNLQETFSY